MSDSPDSHALTLQLTPEERSHLEALAVIRGSTVEQVLHDAIQRLSGRPIPRNRVPIHSRTLPEARTVSKPERYFYIAGDSADRLLAANLAVVRSTTENQNVLACLGKDDVLLMYVSRLGIVAKGAVAGHWDRRVHRLNGGPELRLAVKWRRLDKHLPLPEVRRLYGCLPNRALQRIATG